MLFFSHYSRYQSYLHLVIHFKLHHVKNKIMFNMTTSAQWTWDKTIDDGLFMNEGVKIIEW